MRPYVVSGDVDILLARWAARHNFRLPSQKFFASLQSVLVEMLSSIFGTVEFVPSAELQNPAIPHDADGFPLVTLDRVYVQSSYRIELSRTVLPDLSDGPVGARGGAPPIEVQLRNLRENLNGTREIVIYDDVIFSGHLLSEACLEIERAGFKIRKVLCGIGIQEGVERVTSSGWSVVCGKTYAEVIDQICERDFYPGVDYAGRTLADNHAVGLPYLLPFGNPAKWASIPPQETVRFSKFCIRQAVRLFGEIGHESKRVVLCSDIDRRLAGLGTNGATIFVDYLEATGSKII